MLKLIDEHDKYVKKSLNVQLNYEKINKKLKSFFITFWIVALLSYIGYFISVIYNDSDLYYLYYAVQIEIPNHLIHLQGFQFVIFFYAIERRIKLVSSCNFGDNEAEVRKALEKICHIWKAFYECIGMNLLICMIQIYISTVINLFWLGMSFMKVNYATPVGT